MKPQGGLLILTYRSHASTIDCCVSGRHQQCDLSLWYGQALDGAVAPAARRSKVSTRAISFIRRYGQAFFGISNHTYTSGKRDTSDHGVFDKLRIRDVSRWGTGTAADPRPRERGHPARQPGAAGEETFPCRQLLWAKQPAWEGLPSNWVLDQQGEGRWDSEEKKHSKRALNCIRRLA